MAKDKRGRKGSSQDAGPAQPSWRRPPVRPRKKIRQQAVVAPPVTQKPAKAAKTATRARLQWPTPAAALRAARRLLALVLAAGLVVGMIQLLRLPQLAASATSTQIGGSQRITPEQIYAASGIEGRNIFLIRPAEVAGTIQGIGGVKAVQVHVRLPNQVLIDVWEHTPLVAWQQQATMTWLAADGSIVPQAGADPPVKLIAQMDAPLDAGSPLTALLLKDLAALHAAQPDVKELYYNTNQGLYFQTPEGWNVWLGDSGTLAEKMALLNLARQEITRLGKQVQVIDLRHSNQRAIWW